MRVILDISINADNRIEGSASWPNGTEPVQFSGWLALMRLVEDANVGQPASSSSAGNLAGPPGIKDPLVAGPGP
jgi:hypothetical protein